MKKALTLLALQICLASNLPAQTETTGLLSFNTGRSPVEAPAVQKVSLFGCHYTQVDADLFWDTEGQVVGHIPYGPHQSDGKRFFLSKYYIASPPVFRHTEGASPFIGLVIPDRFSFQGPRPAQIVNLDYRILEPTYLHHVAADFDHEVEGLMTCREQGVESIPINTHCPDFPWRNGGLGAAGIGQLTADGGGAFVPSLEKQGELLNCSVTLLDDVILEAEVFFDSDDSVDTKSMNLTELQKAGESMKLRCLPRQPGDIPAGCRSPAP